MKEEQNIEKIINKFLDFLTTIVEEQEDLKINMSEDLETYYYVICFIYKKSITR